MEKLDRRVRDDIDGTKSAIGNGVAEFADRRKLSEEVGRRPLLAVASALGIGIALGAISDRGAHAQPKGSDRGREAVSSGGGVFSDLIGAALGSMTSTAGGAINDEVHGAIQRLFRGDSTMHRTPVSARDEEPFGGGEGNGRGYPSPTAKGGP
jgi:hypothetical protein